MAAHINGISVAVFQRASHRPTTRATAVATTTRAVCTRCQATRRTSSSAPTACSTASRAAAASPTT